MAMDYNAIPGEYNYSQNPNGKMASGVVALGPTSERNLAAQKNVGGADRQPGEQGGHLIANRFGGRNDLSNLDAQAANVNQRDQAKVERNIAKLAANPNNTVAMSVANFTHVGERPTATMINVGVRNNITGEIDEQHISFQNASHALQQSWNDTANYADQTIDPSQNIGMTDEQRNIANELCGAEDMVDDRLGSGWGYREVDDSFWNTETIAEGERVVADAIDNEEIDEEIDENMEPEEINEDVEICGQSIDYEMDDDREL